MAELTSKAAIHEPRLALVGLIGLVAGGLLMFAILAVDQLLAG